MKPKMANMSYCRFENTLRDLRDCYKHWDEPEEELNEYEKAAKKALTKLCLEVASYSFPGLARSEDNPLNYARTVDGGLED